MSSSRMPKCSGKMSSSKVLTKQKGPAYSLYNASGRVGAGKPGFKNTLTKEAGK